MKTTVTRTIEVDVECVVEIEPGEPCVMWGDNAHPGCGPSAEILSAVIEGTKFDLLALLSESDIRAIEDEAIDQAAEDEQSARYDYEESRGER